MPRTPKASDGESPKKRTRKPTTQSDTDTKVLKTNTATQKATKPKAANLEIVPAPTVEATHVAPATPARKEVLTMLSLEERIRARAYDLYLRRGGQGGSPEQDWFQAAAEVYGESVA